MNSDSMLPPDRAHIITEQRHPRSMNLCRRDVRSIIDLMIEDQAAALQALRSATPALNTFIEHLITNMQAGGRLIYIGAGTSGRLGVLDASECPPTFQSDPNQVIGIIAGGDAALRRSSEGMEDDPSAAQLALQALNLTQHDTVLGIAAGGTTPYVLGGITIAKQLGAVTALLTCASQQTHPDNCDHLIVLRTGPEILTGSTRLKAGTATKIALNIITTAAFVRMGKAYSNLMVDLRATNNKLTDRALRILQQLCPALSREQAAGALRLADGELKTAIIMQRLNLDAPAARQRLRDHHHRLSNALSE